MHEAIISTIMSPKIIRFCLIFSASLFLGSASLCADVTLKVTAENPSELEERKVTVQSYLPAGLRPEDVVDAAGFQVIFDDAERRYYIRREVVLKPKEKTEYVIQVRDIWQIDPGQLTGLQTQSKTLVSKLQGTEYAALSRNLGEMVAQDAKKILDLQLQGMEESVTRHIEIFNVNQERFNRIRSDVGVLENLLLSLGGSIDRLMGDSIVAAKTLDELEKDMQGRFDPEKDSFAKMDAKGAPAETKTRTLKIEVSNPSKSENRSIPVLYFLPSGMDKQDVVDAKELTVRYDFEKNLYYLYHEGVPLDPGQTKVFEVIIREKPLFSASRLAAVKLRSDLIAENLGDTAASQELQTSLTAFQQRFSELISAQKEASKSIEGFQQKAIFDQAVEELETMAKGMEQTIMRFQSQGGWKPLPDTKIKDISEQLGVDPATLRKIENMLVTGKRGTGTGADIHGVRILAGTVFKGKAPSTATTWKIIYIILGFVGLASIFFVFSIVQESIAPAFDILTGLPGKKDFLKKLKQYSRQDLAVQGQCAVLMMRLRNFKSIIERYGYVSSDRVLKETGHILRSMGRSEDVVARYENDAFGMILPGMDRGRAEQVAGEIIKTAADHPLKTEKGENLEIEMKYGVSVFPQDGMDGRGLIAKAFQAADGKIPSDPEADSSHA